MDLEPWESSAYANWTNTPLLVRLVAAGEAEPPTADLYSLATLPPMEPDGIDVAADLAASREEERW